jgi:excisionase family DNA binding protein
MAAIAHSDGFTDLTVDTLATALNGDVLEASRRRPSITIKAAAVYANVCEKTIYNWFEAGLLHRVRIGKVTRVRVTELDALLTQGAGKAATRSEGDDE